MLTIRHFISSDAGPSSKPDTDVGGAGGGSSERDDSFREFRRLCADIAEENSYTGKTAIVSKFITKGASGGKQIRVFILIVHLGCS